MKEEIDLILALFRARPGESLPRAFVRNLFLMLGIGLLAAGIFAACVYWTG